MIKKTIDVFDLRETTQNPFYNYWYECTPQDKPFKSWFKSMGKDVFNLILKIAFND